jgi:hypothetical protein
MHAGLTRRLNDEMAAYLQSLSLQGLDLEQARVELRERMRYGMSLDVYALFYFVFSLSLSFLFSILSAIFHLFFFFFFFSLLPPGW